MSTNADPDPRNKILSRPVMIGIFIFLVLGILMLFSQEPVFQQNDKHQWLMLGIPVEFILFALTLVGVALFHHATMQVALTGLSVILCYKLIFTDFNLLHHLFGGVHPILSEITNKHIREGEWPTILNLFGLLLGFALLAKHFEESKVPEMLPQWLPSGWMGGTVLLFLVMILSSFLDNIAAAMIGGTIAMVVFKGNVHIGFLAAIVASSNAGGAGSVVGDTTTTMMWIDGVSPADVLHAFVGSIAAFLCFAFIAAKQQYVLQPLVKADGLEHIKIDWIKLLIVLLILIGAITTNFLMDLPAVGVWIAILIGATFRKTAWHELIGAFKGSVFLLSLVMCASMMPVDALPAASWSTALSLGFVSAVFDNIPLTKLALEQGGYDWGFLAYAVGFGGSMIWFGSSAGVALSNIFPKAKSVVFWIKDGWHVTLGYVVGFFIMLWVVGWHPHAPHKKNQETQNKEHGQLMLENTKNDCCIVRELKASLPNGKTFAVK